MFNFLKEKLKNWVKKAGKEEPEEEVKIIKKPKEGKKAKGKKPKIIATKEQIENKEDLLQEERGIGEKIWEDIEKEKDEEKEKQGKTGFFSFLKKKITEEKFEELFQELEMALFQNNVAYEVVQEIKKYLNQELVGKSPSDIDLQKKLKQALENVLISSPNFVKEIKKSLAEKKPYVIIFIGINGSGKTTTIAKIAHLLKKENLSCCLAAADTFRAASIEQLQKHADNLKIPLIKKEYGSDPASVGFDAVSYAKKHHIDIVLIDTAGRMNTKDSLMKEMEKIVRVNKPDMKIFIGESTTGNDATEQAKAFNDLIDITGIILAKADVDEKGGTAISVSYVTKKPIFFLGTGQSYDDLEVFDKEKMIKNLGL